jgi:glycosyltransferase involved in cell wall biosynthesis
MKIGVNLFHLTSDTGGISQYVLTLLQTWPRFFPQDRFVLFYFPRNADSLGAVPDVHERRLLPTQDEIAQSWPGLDLFFCPFNALYPRPLPLPTVVTLVDVQERFFPGFFSREALRLRFHHYDWSVAMADRVITISDFSRRCLVQLLGADPARTDRIHLCPAELPAAVRPAAWPEGDSTPFLLYPANFWPHKNHAALWTALARLRSEGVRATAVFTGSLLGREAEWSAQVAAAGVADQVRHLGLVPRAELVWLYQHARLLCFPSLFEGFGIPVVEAMRLGTPVACTTTTSVPEVAGPAAVYFDPQNPAELARAIARLWNDPAQRARLAARGRRQSRQFTAERLVREHRQSFARALQTYTPALHAQRTAWAALPETQREDLSVHERLTAARLLQAGRPRRWWQRLFSGRNFP